MPSAFYWPLLVPCAPAGLRRQLTNSLGVSPNRKKRFAVGGYRIERLSSGACFRWRCLRQRQVETGAGIGFAHAAGGGALRVARKSKSPGRSLIESGRAASEGSTFSQGHNGAQAFSGRIEAGALQRWALWRRHRGRRGQTPDRAAFCGRCLACALRLRLRPTRHSSGLASPSAEFQRWASPGFANASAG